MKKSNFEYLAWIATFLAFSWSDRVSAITNGRVLEQSEAESLVYYAGDFPGCSGTVIHPSFLLTAAHCLPHALKMSKITLEIDSFEALQQRAGLWKEVEKLAGSDSNKSLLAHLSQFEVNLIEATTVTPQVSALGSHFKRTVRAIYFANNGDYLKRPMPLFTAHDVAIIELDAPLPLPSLRITDEQPDARKSVIVTGAIMPFLNHFNVIGNFRGTDASIDTFNASQLHVLMFGDSKILNGDSGAPILAVDPRTHTLEVMGVASYFNPLLGRDHLRVARVDQLKEWIRAILNGRPQSATGHPVIPQFKSEK